MGMCIALIHILIPNHHSIYGQLTAGCSSSHMLFPCRLLALILDNNILFSEWAVKHHLVLCCSLGLNQHEFFTQRSNHHLAVRTIEGPLDTPCGADHLQLLLIAVKTQQAVKHTVAAALHKCGLIRYLSVTFQKHRRCMCVCVWWGFVLNLMEKRVPSPFKSSLIFGSNATSKKAPRLEQPQQHSSGTVIG